MVDAAARPILERRARDLARPLARVAPQAGEAVVVLRRGATYAIPATAVKAVRRLRGLEPLPGMPPFVAGLVAVRGDAIAAIDLALLFGSGGSLEGAQRVVVVAVDGFEAALLADEVVGVAVVERASLRQSPAGLSGPGQAAGLGLGDGVGMVLDPGRLLRSAIGTVTGRVVER